MVHSRTLLKSICLRGFRSFGPSARDFPLEALNVLIGPNGSGKSNLVEAFSVLRDRRGVSLAGIRIYRSWQFGPEAAVRQACHPSVPADHLSERLDNLPARLAVLKKHPSFDRSLTEHLRELAPELDDVEVVDEGGALTIRVCEDGRLFPADRVSDGTLHYLCLLAILCDPDPPPLIVIEQPEIGLHPDLYPRLAALLIKAAEHTQLVVTTHSEGLVDGLTGTPEAVVVCEKVGGFTDLTRLNLETLKPFLRKHRLGELWTRGEIGGNRW